MKKGFDNKAKQVVDLQCLLESMMPGYEGIPLLHPCDGKWTIERVRAAYEDWFDKQGVPQADQRRVDLSFGIVSYRDAADLHFYLFEQDYKAKLARKSKLTKGKK